MYDVFKNIQYLIYQNTRSINFNLKKKSPITPPIRARGIEEKILSCGFAEQKLQERLGTESPT